MFLVSGVDLVVAACRNGVIGAFPTVNCRSPEQLDGWLGDIEGRLRRHSDQTGKRSAPICPNLIVHRSNARLSGSAGAVAAQARDRHHLSRIAGRRIGAAA
jgi:nitronate monooxygenase